jgi:hypothetical protein
MLKRMYLTHRIFLTVARFGQNIMSFTLRKYIQYLILHLLDIIGIIWII